MKTVDNEEYNEFVMFQEFDNYIPGQSIVNFYAERLYPTHTERYMASSTKKIIKDELIQKIISKTRFEILDEEIVTVDGKSKIKFAILQKNE